MVLGGKAWTARQESPPASPEAAHVFPASLAGFVNIVYIIILHCEAIKKKMKYYELGRGNLETTKFCKPELFGEWKGASL